MAEWGGAPFLLPAPLRAAARVALSPDELASLESFLAPPPPSSPTALRWLPLIDAQLEMADSLLRRWLAGGDGGGESGGRTPVLRLSLGHNAITAKGALALVLLLLPQLALDPTRASHL